MKKFSYIFIAFICALVFTNEVNAQLYTYTNQVDGYANYLDPNISADRLRRVKGASGVGAGIICPIGFTSKGFTTSDVFATNIPSVVANITPNPGVDIVVTKISAEMRITSTGPIYCRFAYSTDFGATWIDGGVDFTPSISDCGDATVYGEWDVPDFTATDKLYVRFYPYGAINANGRFNISNFNIYGSLDMVDADGDGYGEAIDCDDSNPDIHPGAEEICNAIDEDCNGISDEVSISITPTGDIYLCNDESITLYGTEGYESYQWYKNGSPIPVTTSSIEVENPGYYQVEATQGLCSAISPVQAIAVSAMPFANIYYPEGLDLCADDTIKLKASYDELYNWQWYRDGSPIEGEEWYKLFTTEPGTYYCEVTTVLGCTRNTEEVVINPCRIDAGNAISFMSAYPNPASSTISFNIATGNNLTESAQLIIIGLNGQQVKSLNVNLENGTFNEEITITDLPNGIYSALLIAGGNQFTSRFTVSK